MGPAIRPVVTKNIAALMDDRWRRPEAAAYASRIAAIAARAHASIRANATHAAGLKSRPGPITLANVKRRPFVGTFASAVWAVALASPALAHGDHDARPLARHLEAGPYIVSLWQVYPDVGSAMTPHLIVMFDGGVVPPSEAGVDVAVDSTPMEVRPSITTSNGWETAEGLVEGDVVTVTVSDGIQAWDLDPVVVPPAPTSMIPMPELIYTSIFLTLGTAWWMAGRTARAWRKPVVKPVEQAVIQGGVRS